jgi:hypothetical protein
MDSTEEKELESVSKTCFGQRAETVEDSRRALSSTLAILISCSFQI